MDKQHRQDIHSVPPAGPPPGRRTAKVTAPAVEDRTGRWVLLSTILASGMIFIDASALNVALPALQAGLGASGSQLLWVMNAYLLMLAALILVSGSLGDRLGRKAVFMAGIALFIVGSLAAGSAPFTDFLIGARVVQGIGGALMIPGSLAIITAYFERERRGRAIGTWAAATTAVTVIGPILGGSLASIGLWRGVFFINVPLGVASLVMLYLKVPESRGEESSRRIDYSGAVLAAVGLASLTYGFLEAPESGFGNPQVFITMAVGFLALPVFLLVEWKSSHPMLPLHLFKSRNFTGANLLALFLYGALSVSMFILALNMVQVQGYSATVAGFTFLPFAILLAVLSRWAGTLSDRFGTRGPLVAGTLITAAGLLQLSTIGVTGGPGEFWWTFFPGFILFGVGMGITVVPLTTTVMGSVSSHFAGTASGVSNAVSRVAGVLATAIVGSIALMAFTGALEDRAAGIELSASVREEVEAEAANLGEAAVPASVPPEAAPDVRDAIDEAFVDAFSIVMYIAAGAVLTGTVLTAVFIRPAKNME